MNASPSGLRRHRLPLLGAAVALVLGGVLLWGLRGHGPDPRIEAIRKKGYPVTLAELDAWYPHVPDPNNFALACRQVFASPLFTNQPNQIDALFGKSWQPLRGQALDPEDKADLTAMLSTNEALLRPLYARAGPSRYPVALQQGFAVLLPHLAGCRYAVCLLSAAAILHVGDGQTERALQDIEAAAQVADSLKEEPLLISQMVRMGCWNIIASRLERVLSLGTWNDEQLARLQNRLREAERHPSLVRGLAGEEAAGFSIFREPVHTLGVLSPNSAIPPALSERLRAQMLITGLKVSGLFGRDRAFYLDAMTTNVVAAELPFPERVKTGQRTGGLMPPSRFYILSSMMLPALSKAFVRDADVCAHLRAAETGLAIERFRLAHTNALPASLEALVPTYLPAVPTDPYDGKPLRYKLKQPGYVVYSLGQDEKDNGGLEANPKTPGAPHDITFTLGK